MHTHFRLLFLEDLEHDCGTSIQRELEEMERFLDTMDSASKGALNIYLYNTFVKYKTTTVGSKPIPGPLKST